MAETETRAEGDRFLPRDVCPCLMTKTMTLNTEHRRSPEEIQMNLADTAIFWCTTTMCVHGPDEDDVLPETCRPSRACYEGDPT